MQRRHQRKNRHRAREGIVRAVAGGNNAKCQHLLGAVKKSIVFCFQMSALSGCMHSYHCYYKVPYQEQFRGLSEAFLPVVRTPNVTISEMNVIMHYY